MNRREFITLLGGAAVAWPLPLRAKQCAEQRRLLGTPAAMRACPIVGEQNSAKKVIQITYDLTLPRIPFPQEGRLGWPLACAKQLQERKKPCLIVSLFPSQPPLSAFRALLPMPPRKEAVEAVEAVEVEAAAVPEKFTALAVFPQLSVPAAAVQRGARGTMHPHPITAMLLRVDAIPIHRAR